MRTPKPFQISSDTAAALNELCRSTTLPHGQIMRAKIILQLSEGMTPTEVAVAQRTSPKTVHRWRNRFEKEGLDGLLERPRSGRPTVLDKEIVDRVLYLTTKRIPEEATHWSIELMARYAGITTWQVRQICDALKMAVWQRRPEAGLIVHSDRGSQYASNNYRRLLKAHGFVGSMSRKGDCWDNAVVESFFGSLKQERVQWRNYQTRYEAQQDVLHYISMWYNTDRLHSYLGYKSPAQYESEMISMRKVA